MFDGYAACAGAVVRLQGAGWPPHLPGGHAAQAQHGDGRPRVQQEVQPRTDRRRHRPGAAAHRPTRRRRYNQYDTPKLA